MSDLIRRDEAIAAMPPSASRMAIRDIPAVTAVDVTDEVGEYEGTIFPVAWLVVDWSGGHRVFANQSAAETFARDTADYQRMEEWPMYPLYAGKPQTITRKQ
jgi:hypothetical protein